MQSFMTVSANTQNYYFFPEKQSIRRRKTKIFSLTAPPMPHFLSSCDKFSRLFLYCFTVNFSCSFMADFRAIFVLFPDIFLPTFAPHISARAPPNFSLNFPLETYAFGATFSALLCRPDCTPDCAPEGLRSAFRRNFFALLRLPPEFLRRCPTECLIAANNDADNQTNTNLYINDCL